MANWDTPPTAAELASVKDPWAAPPTMEEAGGPVEKPGLARRILSAATGPFKSYEPLLEKQRQNAGPSIINKNSPDMLAEAGQFVAGIPGAGPQNQEAEERLGRYAEEHPKTTTAMRLLGGLASPVLPSATAAQETKAAVNPLRRAAEATLKPTPEAVFLRSQGVPLTVGQLNPRSAVGQVEEASTSLRGVGASIAAQREAGKKGWQQLVMGQAHPPGMPQVPPDWKLSDALTAIYEGFKPSYEGVRNELIYPAIHNGGKGVPLQSMGNRAGAMQLAALDPAVLATDQTRQSVHNFLQHQLTILPERTGAVGKVGVGDLLQVRSNIRDATRAAIQQQDFTAAKLLSNGEDAITKAIESQASPGIKDALRQTDAKYHAYKIVEDAVARSADSPSGFSPSQLTGAIRASSGRGQFARGGGGDLRELSRAGKAVFESTSPPTGARLLTVGPLGEYGTGPLAFLANRTPAASAPREWNPAGAVFLRAALAAELERHGKRPPFRTMTPAVAQADQQ